MIIESIFCTHLSSNVLIRLVCSCLALLHLKLGDNTPYGIATSPYVLLICVQSLVAFQFRVKKYDDVSRHNLTNTSIHHTAGL